MSLQYDCAIVGAGIAGLIAAKQLAGCGASICLLEKGRGLGGRMATRRWNGAIFDHGAQFFTVRDPRFARWVNEWCEQGFVEPWYDFHGSGMHFRGQPGMTAIAKHLAIDLEIRRETLVRKVSRRDRKWQGDLGNETTITASRLLITAPVPQAMTLLETGEVALDRNDQKALDAIKYHRCIAALAILDQPSRIDSLNGALKLSGEPVQWISDNHRKGISKDVPSATIHSTPAFAEEHWDSNDSVRMPLLLEKASKHLGATILFCQCHRWGFSQPKASFRDKAFVDESLGLAIAGDGLSGGRVEGAALSGLEAATQIIRGLPNL